MQKFPIEEYLDSIYQSLLAAKPQKIELTSNWCNTFKSVPGVYIFREKGKIIYVGETGDISGRMNDVRRTVNHTLRRSIGNTLFNTIEGWQKATSKKRFIDTIEEILNDHFKKNLTVAVIEIPLGRCELEELVIDIHKPEYNKKTRRIKSKPLHLVLESK